MSEVPTVHRIWTIALNTISDIFRRKVLYVGIAATIAFELPAIADFLFSRSMSAAQFIQNALLHQRAAVNFFTVWTSASIYLGIGLASVVLSWEVHDRTILTVLARPVARAEFLVAKWLAVLMMTLAFLTIGVTIGLLYAWDLDVQILPMLKFALTATVVSIVSFTAISLMLSVFLTPVVTSVVGIFMVLAPDMLKQLFEHPWASLRALATLIYYIFPAGMPVNLINESFGKIALNPNYELYSRVMVENLFYGLFAFLLAFAVFSRREIQAAA